MNKKNELSVEMYHRIYRLAIRKVPVDQIAITLDLPINVVKNVVDHFFPPHNDAPVTQETGTQLTKDPLNEKQSYLDIYILQKLRFSVVDINGMMTAEHKDHLLSELNKVEASNMKAVALFMANVQDIDETGFTILQNFNKNFTDRGRYSAILDPSETIEAFLVQHNLNENIPIFGTEKAFEENARKLKKKT